ncbi:hypothetical protein [Labrenzia sp. CE80]|uniref:hypothetical protein n=1 Tax=Labrenzia sp. CE80 TaxID=1788986 RepID=UPI00129B39A3|nr:hypothetical protein [Labrenzia sp. CE80]
MRRRRELLSSGFLTHRFSAGRAILHGTNPGHRELLERYASVRQGGLAAGSGPAPLDEDPRPCPSALPRHQRRKRRRGRLLLPKMRDADGGREVFDGVRRKTMSINFWRISFFTFMITWFSPFSPQVSLATETYFFDVGEIIRPQVKIDSADLQEYAISLLKVLSYSFDKEIIKKGDPNIVIFEEKVTIEGDTVKVRDLDRYVRGQIIESKISENTAGWGSGCKSYVLDHENKFHSIISIIDISISKNKKKKCIENSIIKSFGVFFVGDTPEYADEIGGMILMLEINSLCSNAPRRNECFSRKIDKFRQSLSNEKFFFLK